MSAADNHRPHQIEAATLRERTPKMNTKMKTPAAAPASPVPGLPIFTTAGALQLLWEKACDNMAPHEVLWMADGAAEQVGCEARALAATVEGLASLVSTDENAGSFRDPGELSSLLFNLHNQLNTIAGLSELADGANYRVRLALKGGAK